jgi:MMPL family
LRALVAPLILTATVVLSFAAALGVSAFFFNDVFGFGGADTSFPLFVFVFLVALGIDYNIFLMTRVREEAIKTDARRGALIGLAATGGVITSAGLVLAGTFAAACHHPGHVLDRTGFRGRVRHHAGHNRRPVPTGYRTEPGHRPVDVVAQQVGPETGSGPGGTQRGSSCRHVSALTVVANAALIRGSSELILVLMPISDGNS